MLAWQIARNLYESEPGNRFEDLLGHFFQHGIVHSTPENFLLAKQVCYPESEITPANAWFIPLASTTGSLKQLMGALPHPLSYVIWQRALGRPGQHYHIHPWHKLAAKVGCI
jgi:hypothetical protein